MGRLLQRLKVIWSGGGSPGKLRSTTASTNNVNNHHHTNGSLPTTNINNKPPTPMPDMSGDIKTYKVDAPWIKLDCGLGEAPFWEEQTNTLRFVDIVKQTVHVVDLNKGPSSHRVFKELDISIGCTGGIEGNDRDFIFGGKEGYGIMNRESGEYRYIKKVWTDEEVAGGKAHRMRANDGAIDSQGRFWVGFMNDPKTSDITDEGFVFRLDPDLTLHRVLSNISIPNGTTWSADDKTMYFADSPSRNISAFDYDAPTGTITNKRVFFRIPDSLGPEAVPDGHCIDEEGYMWTAVHGVGRVLRISPQGELVAEIHLPTSQTTCPAFVGNKLVITSAGGGQEGADEMAGSVFLVDVGVGGLKRFQWKGKA